MRAKRSPKDSESKVRQPAATLAGTGFLALDLLYKGESKKPAFKYAGGSFGNVLAISSFLGSRAVPVARLAEDTNADLILKDLRSFGVITDYVTKSRTGITPVIIIRLRVNPSGELQSKYEWRDPKTGERLPRYRPHPRFLAVEAYASLPPVDIFYFDRAEASTLWLATQLKKRGALIVFEPSSTRDDTVFQSCVKGADIIKYSQDRIDPPFTEEPDGHRLEIQTTGSSGLRYRIRTRLGTFGKWNHLEPYSAGPTVDATGCGDWCTAGLLYKIGGGGAAGFKTMAQDRIKSGLAFGQALAAINATFVGARGPMYEVSLTTLLKLANDLTEA